MSGMVCAWCGHGALDGFTWGFADGRLIHNYMCVDDNGEFIGPHDSDACGHDMRGCVETTGVREGMVECDLGVHVVWPNAAVLAESVVKFDADGNGQRPELRARRSGFEPYVIRFDSAPEGNVEVPEDTRAVTFEVKLDGTPYLACRECAGRAWSSETALRPFKAAGARGSRGARRRAAPAEKAAPSGSDGLSEKVRALIEARPMTVAEIAAATGLGTDEAARKAAQRAVRSLGAAKVRDGKSIKWSVATEDTGHNPSANDSTEHE